MLYKNTKVNVRSPDRNTDYFDIVAGVLPRHTLAPFLFIICLDYVLRTSIDIVKDKGFKLAKERNRTYTAQTVIDADYAEDIRFWANTPALAESLQHSLERIAGGIGLHFNADKTEYICFNQWGDISTLKGKPLKRVEKFTYLGSSVSSTNNEINMWLTKAWTAIDKLSVIRKSDLTDNIKSSFFSQQRSCRCCCMDALHGF